MSSTVRQAQLLRERALGHSTDSRAWQIVDVLDLYPALPLLASSSIYMTLTLGPAGAVDFLQSTIMRDLHWLIRPIHLFVVVVVSEPVFTISSLHFSSV